MIRDALHRLRWHLRLGEPGPVERVAVAVAARELAEADVDLPTWRRAQSGARDDAHARERYVRFRVTRLRRDLRTGPAPLLDADLEDRARQSEAFARRAEAYRATPEGERDYHAALEAATRGAWQFALLYYAVEALIVLWVLWLVLR